jgi:hypothetical protein
MSLFVTPLYQVITLLSSLILEVDLGTNKLFSDRRLDIITSTLGAGKTRDTATQSSAPSTPATETYSEADVASRSPSISPQFEIDDPLTQHWQQSPKRSSYIIRRLTRSNNRRSISITTRPLSELPPDTLKEEEDDIVYVPPQFQAGIEMLRVTRKKVTKRICWIDPVTACVGWDSKSSSKCTLSTHTGD